MIQKSSENSRLICPLVFITASPSLSLYSTCISFLPAALTCVGRVGLVFFPGSWHIVEYHSNAGGGKGTVFFLPWRGGATFFARSGCGHHTVEGSFRKKIILHSHTAASQDTIFSNWCTFFFFHFNTIFKRFSSWGNKIPKYAHLYYPWPQYCRNKYNDGVSIM